MDFLFVTCVIILYCSKRLGWQAKDTGKIPSWNSYTTVCRNNEINSNIIHNYLSKKANELNCHTRLVYNTMYTTQHRAYDWNLASIWIWSKNQSLPVWFPFLLLFRHSFGSDSIWYVERVYFLLDTKKHYAYFHFFT